uniref:Na(+)-translocating NADH-quinone reductase subunit F n=1 Tax=uncultured Planctomycetales bacterium HF0200_11L05 TaxID=723607 RepID=E7C3U3_9BACT|nr:Na+-transporting NADH:ubiquinone oxidoreductase, subunit NqrF [uncultured Planctomycetales bacterium HF0200_11L05]
MNELFFSDIFLGVIAFTVSVNLMVIVILISRKFLIASGNVEIQLNEDPDRVLQVQAGDKLLQTLANEEMFLSSACGGKGTCAQCKCVILEGGGAILPTEETHFTNHEKREGWRLSCQVSVKDNMKVRVPDEVFGAKKWECKVISNENVATFIKELVLKLPEGEEVNFKAGGYVQMEIPPSDIDFKDFKIDKKYNDDLERFNFWNNSISIKETVIRAYSMANYPEEKGIMKFNVRIELPPPGTDYPPGEMTSYLFNLKPGDNLTIFGPFGEFFANDSEAEMIFIGGGAGMAPMRSHIFDQLLRINTNRKITFYYGARSLKEVFYKEEYDELARKNENFKWTLALDSPQPEDNWKGPTGFIHQVILDEYLKNHESPEDCEYYMCGPPAMMNAVFGMLDDLGVEPEAIKFDDFGS